MGYDEVRAEAATCELIAVISEDPDREGLCDTLTRAIKTWKETLNGPNEDPRDYLCTQLETGTDKLVLVRDIVFHPVCGHHLLPFYGCAHVGYILRDGGATGLSKLARIVEGHFCHPQVQERLIAQIADAIDEVLHPQGVIVVIEAEYICMSMRGVPKPGSSIITSALWGIMNDGAAHAKMMSLVLGDQR